jgi:F-type H+-transporting ATPase subunit c
MKKWSVWLSALALVMLVAPAAFAQGNAPGGEAHAEGLLFIAAAFGMGIAAFGCGLGQGKIGAAALEGIARNPGAANAMFTPLILSLAFVETLVLFTFLMIYIKVK